MGEAPGRNGLLKTPERVAKALAVYDARAITQDIDHLLNGALFPIEYDEMVIVKDIDFFSMCEHHMLPFFGKVPCRLSAEQESRRPQQDPAVVDTFARRLQVQERLTAANRRNAEAKVECAWRRLSSWKPDISA